MVSRNPHDAQKPRALAGHAATALKHIELGNWPPPGRASQRLTLPCSVPAARLKHSLRCLAGSATGTNAHRQFKGAAWPLTLPYSAWPTRQCQRLEGDSHGSHLSIRASLRKETCAFAPCPALALRLHSVVICAIALPCTSYSDKCPSCCREHSMDSKVTRMLQGLAAMARTLPTAPGCPGAPMQT